MYLSPRLLGAGAAVLFVGIASGAVIGKVPPMKHLAQDYLLPQAGGGELARTPSSALPDHYPIVTPEGRFEVYELSDRGLYRTARYAEAYYPAAYYPEDYAAFDEYADDAGGWADAPVAPSVAPAAIAATREAAPAALVAPPVPERADDDAAPAVLPLIDVSEAPVAQY